MRRKDREVTDPREILAMLGRCEVAHLGLCSGGMPYVVPLNFGFLQEPDGLRIYFHGARQGKKIDLIAENDKACFAADSGHKIIVGGSVCEYSYAYESVMGEGTVSLLADPGEKRAGLACIMRRYGMERPVFADESLENIAVIVLKVSSLTGKRRPEPAAQQ